MYEFLEEGGIGASQTRGRLNVAFKHFAVLTLNFPLVAFVLCIAWSLMFHFKQSTATHCGVENFLPSISSAIGGYYPQKNIWRIAIGIHTIPRLLVAFIYYERYRDLLLRSVWCLARINCVLNIAEILALLGLSFSSSSSNHELHAACFTLFIICAIFYMLLTLLLLKRFRKHPEISIEARSTRLKFVACLVNMCSVAASVYFYVRHNAYCEPYVYTWFALAEYLVVLSNMAYHGTAYYDFFDTKIFVTPHGVKIV